MLHNFKPNPREDLGYNDARPNLPNASEVLKQKNREPRQDRESPLKEWWLKKRDQNRANLTQNPIK